MRIFAVGTKILGGGAGQHLGGLCPLPGLNVEPPLAALLSSYLLTYAWYVQASVPPTGPVTVWVSLFRPLYRTRNGLVTVWVCCTAKFLLTYVRVVCSGQCTGPVTVWVSLFRPLYRTRNILVTVSILCFSSFSTYWRRIVTLVLVIKH